MVRAAAAVAALLLVTACSSDASDDSASEEPSSLPADEPATAPIDAGVGENDASDGSDPSDQSDESNDDHRADRPVKPEPARDAGVVEGPAGIRPDGFTTVTVRVTGDDGDVCEVCLWLADDVEERSRGLMGVTDLGEPVGMLFRFEEPTSGNFFMFGTPMPLSIAWFDAAGTHVAETDMSPCVVNDSSECQRYGPGAEYISAVEMVQGELGVVGIGPGSTIEILEEHETCPVIE